MANTNITFHDSHKPSLQDGKYTVTVSQKLEVKNNIGVSVTSPDIQGNALDFYVCGPRFDLDQSLIHSVYPPVGGKGDYMATLPSMVLNRNTLPWERSPVNGEIDSNSASWLFLLLVDESETAKITEQNNANLSDFISESNNSVILVPGELSRLPAKLNYLKVDSSLSSIFPATLDALQYLSYSRTKEADTKSPVDEIEEHAVLLCNRLPQRGHNSTVYLVSLENNYSGIDASAFFSGITNKSKNYIFPYLYKWQFSAFDDQLYCVTQAIAETLQKANPQLTFPDLSTMYDVLYDNTSEFEAALKNLMVTDITIIKLIKNAAKLPGSTFHDLLSHLAEGFAPFCRDASAQDINATGTVKLPYSKLESAGTPSAWYRGALAAVSVDLTDIDKNFPLITNGSVITVPEKPADLILKDGANGTEDLTYAAAYELGRLTALNDVDFSTEFFKWKTETAMALRLKTLKSISGYKNILHLFMTDAPEIKPIPQHVLDKFSAWKNLQGIPSRYLIPDPNLLPNESIRFFRVDNNWVNAFICGAFSIGHTVEADLSKELTGLFLVGTVTGFLINSLVVSGWPDFEVDIYSPKSPSPPPVQRPNSMIPVRKDNLDVNVRLYLYEGEIAQLNFHLHPGKMHSGFLFENEQFTKNGGSVKAALDGNNCIVILGLKDELGLKDKLGASSIADFAAKMMEGIPTVAFVINDK